MTAAGSRLARIAGGRPVDRIAPDVRAARLAVSFVFATNGIVAASWFVRIPDVQHSLGLRSSELGIALFGLGVGALLVLALAGWAASRFGSRRVTRAAALWFCAAGALPAFAPSMWFLFAALVLMGMSAGAMDVAMNAQGVAVEARYGRPILSSFHAMYSIGAIGGALAGGAIASLGVGPRPHLAAVGLLLWIATLLITRRLLPSDVDARGHGPAFARPTRALMSLGIICFCALLSEGAVNDWSAVYLRRTLETGAGVAATGFAAFSLAMTVGRLAGDGLSARLGPGRLVRAGGFLAAGALAGMLVLGQTAAAVVGFFLVGIGLAAMVPVVVSAAGRIAGIAPGPAIGAVTTTGYTGFLVGPAVIGFVADWTSLPLALGIVVGLCLLAAVLAGAIR